MKDKGEVLQELGDILEHDYPPVKRAIYDLEVALRTRSRRAVYELRDALDHIATLYKPKLTDEEANHHLCELRTHLRRAAVEPTEYLAEHGWLKADGILGRGFWWWPLLCVRKPNQQELIDINREHDAISRLIAQARTTKAAREALPILQDAFRRSQEQLQILCPKEIWSRVFGVIRMAVSIVLAVVVFACKESFPAWKCWAETHPWGFVLVVLLALAIGLFGISLTLRAIHWLWRRLLLKIQRSMDHPWGMQLPETNANE